MDSTSAPDVQELISLNNACMDQQEEHLLTSSPLAPIVLGHPWVIHHNPRVDWGHNSVSVWSDSCYASCLVSSCSSVSCSLLQNLPVNLSNVPKEYLDLKEVFSKSRAASLPPHHPYDCAIDLVPGTSPPKGKLYSLSTPEREAMEKYISDSLAAVHSPFLFSRRGRDFFFVGKKDGSLRTCIDYQGLNNITVKNTYPLPLMSSAFERLQGASIFTKGHFEYQVVPFRLSNSPAFFQALVNEWPAKALQRWSSAADSAFTILKSRFVSAPILVAPDPTRQFVVKVDASEVRVGAVLSQHSAADYKMHPCAFFSCRLSPAERNYDIGNRELLAVKLALEKWRHWLEGSGSIIPGRPVVSTLSWEIESKVRTALEGVTPHRVDYSCRRDYGLTSFGGLVLVVRLRIDPQRGYFNRCQSLRHPGPTSCSISIFVIAPLSF
ncbi:Transposon Tf2-9 polyprotein [Labeo rohita]|uniref:Transposon Tf2-9 polyprotein n=1 Tax=Labeo rohita TaxID=84645 RepID=A0ABQ8L1B3_LABRO|nr:Transposon Tf2-9 polyprotein [Labeo rohita]